MTQEATKQYLEDVSSTRACYYAQPKDLNRFCTIPGHTTFVPAQYTVTTSLKKKLGDAYSWEPINTTYLCRPCYERITD